jgi:hypothetical protein
MDPEKFKEMCPHVFHRKAGLYPVFSPFLALAELARYHEAGTYDVMPSKGRGHKGTAIRVWRRHVNINNRLGRAREIRALWALAVGIVLGEDARHYEFLECVHEAYIIFYCTGIDLPIRFRRLPTRVPTCPELLTDEEQAFLKECKMGLHDRDLYTYSDPSPTARWI